MIVGVPRETFPGERRVALVPVVIPSLVKAGLEVSWKPGQARRPAIRTPTISPKGRRSCASRAEVFGTADIVVQVLVLWIERPDRQGRSPPVAARPGADRFLASAGLDRNDSRDRGARRHVVLRGVDAANDPRQSMDALSSMATICGYTAVIIAADKLPRMFPMLTTAAGTITPARVLVIGAGVAGLQAIATARRLGAVTSAYDMRPAAKEQVQSLGGRFVELPIEAQDAQDARGYARAQDETFYQRQRELLGRVIAESDVVITAAVIPGKKSPVLVTAEMVAQHVARLGDRRPGCGTRRQLRADPARGDCHRARRHHHRLDQPGQRGPLPRQPDVRPEHQCVPRFTS